MSREQINSTGKIEARLWVVGAGLMNIRSAIIPNLTPSQPTETTHQAPSEEAVPQDSPKWSPDVLAQTSTQQDAVVQYQLERAEAARAQTLSAYEPEQRHD